MTTFTSRFWQIGKRILTILAILLCLLFVSALLSALFDPADPFTPMLAFPVTVGLAWLASWLYRQIFPDRFWTGHIVMLLGVLLLVFYTVKSIPPVEEKGVTREQAFAGLVLPESAVNIDYRRGCRQTCHYSFDVSEEDFLTWIKSDSTWEYCRPITASEPSNWSDYTDVTQGWIAGDGRYHGKCAIYNSQTGRAAYWTFY